MKPTTGSPRPRRTVAPKPRQKVRLDLKRRPESDPAPEVDVEKKSRFWVVVMAVALLHVVIIAIGCLVYLLTPAPKPPEPFISLLPQGDVVKGTAGAQEAHKVGPTTSAPTVQHHTSSTPPAAVKPPKPVTPPKPKLLLPPPTIEPPALLTPATLDKPVPPKPAPPKPTPPKPKVKVDLTLADAPDSDKPVTKPKEHAKKPVEKPSDDKDDTPDHPDSSGLSKEQIAAKLGDKLEAAGVKTETNTGISGSSHSAASPFADFYLMLHDQVMANWTVPNINVSGSPDPVVQIHVEKNGFVPAESVRLIRSSGNQPYDDSAVSAAKALGYLHSPLPNGCPPDISITFKPNS